MAFKAFLKDKVRGSSEATTKSSSQHNNHPSSSSTPPSKRGLCWPVENFPTDPVFPFTRPASKISWLYNWSPVPTPDCASLLFVPMQWNFVGVERLAERLGGGVEAVLVLNEPELEGQADLEVGVAVRGWLEWVEPLRRREGLRCGSPGISCAGHAVGWLKAFLSGVREGGGDVDFLCLHWYGSDLGGFYDYIWSARHQLDASKPVWITEFACTNWDKDNPLPREHVENFARESVKYLDSLDWVERYAWFGPMRDTGTVGKWARMLDDEGQLTRLGRAYRDE